MPSKSPAQMRMMAAAAHDPEFADKVGVPQDVASEFNQVDRQTQARALAQAMSKPRGKVRRRG